jgi:hypothetical protein
LFGSPVLDAAIFENLDYSKEICQLTRNSNSNGNLATLDSIYKVPEEWPNARNSSKCCGRRHALIRLEAQS